MVLGHKNLVNIHTWQDNVLLPWNSVVFLDVWDQVAVGKMKHCFLSVHEQEHPGLSPTANKMKISSFLSQNTVYYHTNKTHRQKHTVEKTSALTSGSSALRANKRCTTASTLVEWEPRTVMAVPSFCVSYTLQLRFTYDIPSSCVISRHIGHFTLTFRPPRLWSTMYRTHSMQ